MCEREVDLMHLHTNRKQTCSVFLLDLVGTLFRRISLFVSIFACIACFGDALVARRKPFSGSHPEL